MISILSAAGRRTLAEFVHRGALLAFDYDGTLAPISSTPARARMRPTTRVLLRRVAAIHPTIVISGRAYDDIARLVRAVPLRQVFGNHGIEPFWTHRAGAALVRGWVTQLRTQLAAYPGVSVEDKTYSAAVHYRHAADPAKVKRVVAQAIRELRGARAIPGRAAVNLIPGRGPNKGVALRRACRALACRDAIYVGDDGTDEDAFNALSTERLLAIRIGRSFDSHAAFTLPRQRDIDGFLRAVIASGPR